MNPTAKVVITAGPDRGKEFTLGDELIHIGRGAENHIILQDGKLNEHQASIMCRNGRYAVYAAAEAAVEVDGNEIPEKRWVWLPEHATIRLGQHNTIDFASTAANGKAASAADETETPPPPEIQTSRPEKPRPPAKKKTNAKRASKTARPKRPPTERNVARFITDQAGDPLVRLGEDGHMPELTLAKSNADQAKRDAAKQKNPIAIYAAIAVSVAMSLAMLFMDATPRGATSQDRVTARRAIRQFYGQNADDLQLYQRLLRQAELAHSRGDRVGERRAYKTVLTLLNSEDLNPFTGLTGSPGNDEQLKNLIAILMSD